MKQVKSLKGFQTVYVNRPPIIKFDLGSLFLAGDEKVANVAVLCTALRRLLPVALRCADLNQYQRARHVHSYVSLVEWWLVNRERIDEFDFSNPIVYAYEQGSGLRDRTKIGVPKTDHGYDSLVGKAVARTGFGGVQYTHNENNMFTSLALLQLVFPEYRGYDGTHLIANSFDTAIMERQLSFLYAQLVEAIQGGPVVVSVGGPPPLTI